MRDTGRRPRVYSYVMVLRFPRVGRGPYPDPNNDDHQVEDDMKTIYATTLLGLSILLFGCGGGGGGGSSSAPVGQTPPPTTPTVPPSVTGATGVWEGTFTDTGTYAVIGLIRGGQARIFSAQE